jgi:hypothetical protein
MSDVEAFRALSYAFTVATEDPEAGAAIGRGLRAFHVPVDEWKARSYPPDWEVERWEVRAEDGDHVVQLGDRPPHRASARLAAVDHLLWAVDRRVAALCREFFILDTAAVARRDGGAVLLAGPQGAGKSTVTLALLQAGFAYLSDELAPIDPVGGTVHPYPRAITLRAGAAGLFPGLEPLDGEAADGQVHLDPETLGLTVAGTDHPVRTVVILEQSRDAGGVAAVSRGQLVHALAGWAPSLPVYGRRSLAVLDRLARSCTAVRVTFREPAEAVEAILGLENAGTSADPNG